jgi:DNA-binding transcriptional ArsR family regulator
MSLDNLLNSKVKRRIIRVLWKIGSTNIMDLARRTNSTYNQLIPHLVALEKEGVVSEHRYGRMRMITLERENEKTKLLLQALKILDKAFPPSRPNLEGENINRLHEDSEHEIATSSLFSETSPNNTYQQ